MQRIITLQLIQIMFERKTLFFLVVLIYQIFPSQSVSKHPSALELISHLGFKGEAIQVQTKDGFILKPIRIAAPSSCKNNRIAAFLHGQASSPKMFVANFKNTPPLNNSLIVDFCEKKIDRFNVGNSLALDLVQRCFEVWLLTFRGTEQGLEHLQYKESDEQFWNWSYDEVINYDLKAQFDYIQSATGKEKVTFIGHSLGGPFGLLLATYPKYEKMLDSAFLLGPITPFRPEHKVVKAVTQLTYSLLMPFRNVNGPVVNQPLVLSLLKYSCDKPIAKGIALLMQLGYGYDLEQFDVSRTCDYVHYSKMSTKSAVHGFQMVTSPDGNFHKYDYGYFENIHRYGYADAPIYNLSSISLKNITIFYGLNDNMAPILLVRNWKDLLKVKLRRFSPVKYRKFNHIDFLMGKDVGKILNWEILEALQEVHCGQMVQ